MTKLSEKAREKAARRKTKYKPFLSVEDRERMKKRAQNPPYLDKVLSIAAKVK